MNGSTFYNKIVTYIYISYDSNTHFFHGNISTHNWPAPNVSGFIAQLVEHRTGIARSRVQTPLKSWIFFFFQASLRNCLNCVYCNDHFFIFKIVTATNFSFAWSYPIKSRCRAARIHCNNQAYINRLPKRRQLIRERDSFFAVWSIRVLSALQLFSSCTKKECSTLKILVCLGLTNPMLHITFSFYPCSQTIALDTPSQKIRHPHMAQINGLTYKHLKWEKVRFTMIRSDCLIRFSL